MKESNKVLPCENCKARSKGIFCELNLRAQADVDMNKTTNIYKKGQIVFHQGNPAYGLYCINRGKLKMTQTGPEGKESIIGIAGYGDVLGHRSLYSGEVYGATVSVLEDATICFLSKEFIFKTIQEQPSIALKIIQKLSQEMGATEKKNASMSQKSVRERLAELLLTLKKTYGIQEGSRFRLDIKLTREDLGNMIGTSPETVIRFMTEFRDQGLMEQEGKTIFILNEKKLSELV